MSVFQDFWQALYAPDKRGCTKEDARRLRVNQPKKYIFVGVDTN